MRALVAIFVFAGCTADVEIRTPAPEVPHGSGGGSGSGSGNESAITPTSYLEQIARIQCDQAFRCRADFPPDAGYTFESVWSSTPDECVHAVLEMWQPYSIETEIAKGRIQFDGSAAIACLDGVTFAASCTDYWSRGIEWADACYHVINGMVPSGGECATDYACQSYYCDQTAHSCY